MNNNPMTQIKIGSRVITRKFEEQTNDCSWFSSMSEFIDKEGEITEITPYGNYRIHRYIWPPSAVEPIDPPFQPEYGKEYEFKFTDPDRWNKATFVGFNPNKNSKWKYIAMINEDDPQPFEFCRPIRKGLEDEIREACQNNVRADKILSIIAKHRTEPTGMPFTEDEFLKEFEKQQSINEKATVAATNYFAMIATVRHFLKQGI